MTGVGRPAQRRPLRRVLYRSKAAIVARFVLGVMLGVAAFVVASPALSTDYPPPPPVGLYIATNSYTAPWGELELAIDAKGCTNPAIIEGVLTYPEKTWTGPRITGARVPKGLPSTAVIALGGARLVGAQVALGNGNGVQADGESTGPFSQPPFRTTQTFAIERNIFHPYTIRSHSYSTTPLTAVIDQRSPLGTLNYPAGAIAFHSRQWAATQAPLHFRFAADLVQTASYHRCYVAVPEVLALNRNEGYYAAEGVAGRLILAARRNASQLHLGSREVPPIIWDVLAASVDVMVSGRVPVSDSVGPDGKATSVGVHYGCRLPKAPREAGEEPNVLHGEVANPNCSATPLFAAQGVDTDISRRLFLGGLIGGLAATLIIESLFIGETPDRSALKATKGVSSE